MSIQDKVTGRLKQAAGGLTGDKKLRDQGVREERKAEAKRELREAQQHAEHLRDEIARLEYGSDSDGGSRQTARDEPASKDQDERAQTRSQRSADDAVDTRTARGTDRTETR